MAVYTYTLADVRTRAEFKLRDNQSSTQVDAWTNDVIQAMTAEVFFDELYREDESTYLITGDGINHIFDLPEDFAAFSWVSSDLQNQPLEETTPRGMIEDWRSNFDRPVTTPQAYTLLGRSGTAGANNVPVFVVKFDSIPATSEIIYFAYYALHPLLALDADPILLPQNLLSTIVDGVLMESDSWNDSDQFALHRDRFMDKMNQLKRNQNRRPNLRRGMGRSPRSGNMRPGRVQFPPDYPDVWGR